MPALSLLCGDALAMLKTLPSDSVHAIVTSPPYYGLRDYGTAQWEGGDAACDHTKDRSLGVASSTLDGGKESTNHQREASYREVCGKCGARRIDQQLGLERTLDEFLERLVAVFEEVKRVMHPSATCWVDMGDSYANSGVTGVQGETGQRADRRFTASGMEREVPTGLKPKDRMMVPYHLALAMQARGWWLRDIICWHKPAPMPESVTDRCTQSWEPIFMFAKASSYFFDSEAIKEPMAEPAHAPGNTSCGRLTMDGSMREPDRVWGLSGTRNPRNLWRISPEPFTWQLCESCGRIYTGSEFAALPQSDGAASPKLCHCCQSARWLSHYATFPTDLPKRCILAGTSAKGVCERCGEPWVRQVENGAFDLAHQRACGGDANGEYYGQSTKNYASAKAQDASTTKARILRGMVEKKTVGWIPGCQCAAPVVPATVLDPFAGTCSTLVAALELGRRAIGIDLNENYLKLARLRCGAVTPSLALA